MPQYRRPGQNRKKKKTSLFSYRVLLPVLACALVALAVLIAVLRPNDEKRGGTDAPARNAAATALPEDAGELLTTLLTATNEPEAVPADDTAWPAATKLPVYAKGQSADKSIAVMIGGCDKAENLARLLDVCERYGARATLFPKGRAAEDEAVARQILRAYALHMELENGTYSDPDALYALSDAELADEIYKGQLAVSKAAGVRYGMHFLRTSSGKGVDDARTGAYLCKLGYIGTVEPGFTGTGASQNDIRSALKAGTVYLFTTSDADIASVEQFIPYAVGLGYNVVTLNEIFSLPQNGTSALPAEGDPYYGTVPPEPYAIAEYATLKKGAGSRDVYLLQQKLLDLGYLQYERATGLYGETTKKAVHYFQVQAGLGADGIAGEKTQQLLFSDDAQRISQETIERMEKELKITWKDYGAGGK